MKVAVLGLGTMGQGMAHSTLRAEIPTVVWNRDPAVAGSFADGDVAITMVTDGAAVMSIADDLGMLEALPAGAVWAQMSTIGVEATETIAAMVKNRRQDLTFIDAPVSGSKVPMLTIFASGPEAARPKVDPVFAALGQRTVWVGPVGTGSKMKLVNNTLLAFGAEGVANSIAMAHQLGLDTHSVLETFMGGPLISPWAAGKFQRIDHEDYSAEFPLKLALKDVHLALEHAGQESFTALAALAREWEQIVEQRVGDEDVAVVARVLER